MRINVYLNEENYKDRIIIEHLKTKYNCQSYIKEMLFSLANEIEPKDKVDSKLEIFEDIKGIECIDL